MNLNQYRQQIDKIDSKIIELLSQRSLIVKKIGKYKKQNNLAIVDKKREDDKIETLTKLAEKYNLSKSFIEAIWRNIFTESYKIEE